MDSLFALGARFLFLADGLGLPAPAGAATGGGQGGGAAAAADAAAQAPPPAGMSPFVWILWIGIFVGFYFLMIRPQRKREKQRQEMILAIKAGDSVLTTGGLFGKVVDVGEDSFLVEFGTNRGLRVPVFKNDVLGIREPRLAPPPKTEA